MIWLSVLLSLRVLSEYYFRSCYYLLCTLSKPSTRQLYELMHEGFAELRFLGSIMSILGSGMLFSMAKGHFIYPLFLACLTPLCTNKCQVDLQENSIDQIGLGA